MAPGRYEIRLHSYDSNWKEKVDVKYSGAIEQQMKDLLRGVAPNHSSRGIKIYIYDTVEERVVGDEHVY